MDEKTVLVLGGYGGAGSPIVRLLLRETPSRMRVAGRTLARAAAFVDELAAEFPNRDVAPVRADASDPASLARAFDGVDIVVVASTTTERVRTVAQAALDANADYLDIHFPERVVMLLEPLASAVADAGRGFVTQGGFHPGVPAALVRYAAPRFDSRRRAVVAMAMTAQFDRTGSARELIEETAAMRSELYRDGRWRRAGYKDARAFDFGEPFGARRCYPLPMPEMRTMPDAFGLKETGVYVAGFNGFVDNVVFPLAMVLGGIRRGFGANLCAGLLVWGLRRFSPSASHVTLILDADGERDGKPLSLRVVLEHADPYFLTAAPVVACLLQMLDGSATRPGISMMAHLVEPARFLDDMRRMGVTVRETTSDIS